MQMWTKLAAEIAAEHQLGPTARRAVEEAAEKVWRYGSIGQLAWRDVEDVFRRLFEDLPEYQSLAKAEAKKRHPSGVVDKRYPSA